MTPTHRLALAALLHLAVAGPVAAQPPLPPQPRAAAGAPSQATQAAVRTRAEELAAEQARKAGQVAPEGPTGFEKTLVRVMSSPLLSGAGGTYPWFGSVFGGAGFAAGGGYLKKLPNDTRFNAVAGISINGSTLLEATFNAPDLFAGRLEPRLVARKQNVNDVRFSGVGPDSSRDRATEFEFDPTVLGGGLAYKPGHGLEFTGGYEWMGVDTDIEGVLAAGFTPRDAPGLGERYSYDVLRTSAALDTRPSPAYATRGSLARVAFSRFVARDAAGYSFDEVELEGAHLVPLLRNQYVLAFRALGTFTSSDDGNRVPVALMPFLGSGNTLRGFANRRFYDTNRVLVTGEYRWLPSRYLDMAVFLDAGQVAPTADAFRVRDFETSWGLGLRLHGPAFSALRIEIARSREQWGFVVGASQPF